MKKLILKTDLFGRFLLFFQIFNLRRSQRYKNFGNKTLLGEKSAEKLQISENVLIFAFENI